MHCEVLGCLHNHSLRTGEVLTSVCQLQASWERCESIGILQDSHGPKENRKAKVHVFGCVLSQEVRHISIFDVAPKGGVLGGGTGQKCYMKTFK